MAKRRFLIIALFALIALVAFSAILLGSRKTELDGTGLTFLWRCSYDAVA